jgi:hypothetical protein
MSKKLPFYVFFSVILPICESLLVENPGPWYLLVVFLTCSIPNLIVYWSPLE